MIKAVIFDIGGVVVGSPVVGIEVFGERKGLPKHYLNNAITARGKDGSFQRLERNEVALPEFYKLFGRELSDHEAGNEAYRAMCRKRGIKCPPLPTELHVDGEELWTTMMRQAAEPDPIVLNAINHLRRNPNLKLAALTNNHVDQSSPSEPSPSEGKASPKRPRDQPVTVEELRNAYSQQRHTATDTLRSMFDHFVESAKLGMRKPDPKFYQAALDLLQCRADEAVFLDDIGLNLVAAKQLGMKTIRVLPQRSLEAIRELEALVGMDLTSPQPSSSSAKL